MIGQATDKRCPVPFGEVPSVQDRPPDIVFMRVDPAPVLPLFPTATQFSRVEHEIPEVSMSSEGAACKLQVCPPLFVLMT